MSESDMEAAVKMCIRSDRDCKNCRFMDKRQKACAFDLKVSPYAYVAEQRKENIEQRKENIEQRKENI